MTSMEPSAANAGKDYDDMLETISGWQKKFCSWSICLGLAALILWYLW
jgi:hypothetical protein